MVLKIGWRDRDIQPQLANGIQQLVVVLMSLACFLSPLDPLTQILHTIEVSGLGLSVEAVDMVALLVVFHQTPSVTAGALSF